MKWIQKSNVSEIFLKLHLKKSKHISSTLKQVFMTYRRKKPHGFLGKGKKWTRILEKKGASSGFLSEGKGPSSPSEEDKNEGIVRRRRWHGPLWQEWPLQPANYTKINYIASHWTRGPLHLKKGTSRTLLWNGVLTSYIDGKSKANNVYKTSM